MAKDDEYMDEIEEQGTDGFATGLVVITTLILIAAIILVDLAAKGYGAGTFLS